MRVPFLLSVLALAACTQATPEAVLTPQPLAPATAPVAAVEPAMPLGQASKTGDFGSINDVPRGQTAQMTPRERSQLRGELSVEAARGAALRDSATREAAARADVAALREHALAEQRRRLLEIERTNRLP